MSNNVEIAVNRLNVYSRISQAAIKAKDGATIAPILHLSNEQLVALFAPQQINKLIKLPLGSVV